MKGKIEVNGASLAERLRAGRAMRNMLQDTLAEKVGVSTGTVSGWEKGTTSPRMAQIQKIATTLKLPLSWLIGATDCMAQED